jgi:hypothetical protein
MFIWPPAPSPAQPTTGYKHVTLTMRAEHYETLSVNGTPRWWTGVRISSQHTEQYECELVAMGRSITIATWRQPAGSWMQLPWAIPSIMATQCNMELRVRSISEAPAEHTSLRISYEDIELDQTESYMFVNEQGVPYFFWDGVRAVMGTSLGQGSAPTWEVIYNVMPPFHRLEEQTELRLFCYYAWRDIV